MAAALEGTSVTYEDLADLEREFEDVETEIIRQQVALSAPLYVKRTATVSKIPNFWPLVLEQAPPDIDQYIQPSDSALLLSSLTSVSVSHFEIDPASPSKSDAGDPRSVSIRFEFSPNDGFSDSVLEKKFWYRQSKDGWTGLVSEPVRIHWKSADKDLTGGLLDMVCSAWEAELKSKANPSNGSTSGKTSKKLLPEHEALRKKIEGTGMGGLSFFAWFGFIGPRVGAEESAEAKKLDKERKGKKDSSPPEEAQIEEGDQEDEEEELYMELEIFPDGDDLAIAFSEDLWPGAIKYFTQAQEQDALSDLDFESGDEDLGDLLGEVQPSSDSEDEPPKKKQKSS
ncbi:Uncharacterized protein BP5553_05706 [Venustampulla echinocandica]|uniref:Nap family protein n=1 Tax=Venustampulla echinocandica TaxID=2656787 RepID=A0A370TLF3_9HELO|nr:Uncharacterized protein BP5553_05706 [Venustampulla echinocandica]RDL36354.1 Uncharacterized protein BP5553_05706 [Venustampulla echinocandica]